MLNFEVKYNVLSGWYVLDLKSRPVTMHGAHEGIHNLEDAKAFANKMNAKFPTVNPEKKLT